MKIYVDFDGVIFDSEKILFEEYHKLKERNEEIKMNYLIIIFSTLHMKLIKFRLKIKKFLE